MILYLAEFRKVFLITEGTLPQLCLIVSDGVSDLQLFLVGTSMCNARHMTDY